MNSIPPLVLDLSQVPQSTAAAAAAAERGPARAVAAEAVDRTQPAMTRPLMIGTAGAAAAALCPVVLVPWQAVGGSAIGGAAAAAGGGGGGGAGNCVPDGAAACPAVAGPGAAAAACRGGGGGDGGDLQGWLAAAVAKANTNYSTQKRRHDGAIICESLFYYYRPRPLNEAALKQPALPLEVTNEWFPGLKHNSWLRLQVLIPAAAAGTVREALTAWEQQNRRPAAAQRLAACTAAADSCVAGGGGCGDGGSRAAAVDTGGGKGGDVTPGREATIGDRGGGLCTVAGQRGGSFPSCGISSSSSDSNSSSQIAMVSVCEQDVRCTCAGGGSVKPFFRLKELKQCLQPFLMWRLAFMTKVRSHWTSRSLPGYKNGCCWLARVPRWLHICLDEHLSERTITITKYVGLPLLLRFRLLTC